MSDFGDLDDDDVYGVEPADPEQVARKFHDLRRDHGEALAVWESLGDADRARAVAVAVALLAWGRRQGVFR